MPFVAVPDHLAGDTFTQTNWATHLEGNFNAGVERPLWDSGSIGVAAASFDITSIPATFAHLLIVAQLRGDTAALNTNLNLRFNGDTTAVYNYGNINTNGATVATTEQYGQVSIICGAIPAATAAGSKAGPLYVLIPNYATTTFHKSTISLLSNIQADAGPNQALLYIGHGHWRNAAIAATNRLTLLPSAGNFAVGSRLTLLGIPYI